jgi:hypothetical protein
VGSAYSRFIVCMAEDFIYVILPIKTIRFSHLINLIPLNFLKFPGAVLRDFTLNQRMPALIQIVNCPEQKHPTFGN